MIAYRSPVTGPTLDRRAARANFFDASALVRVYTDDEDRSEIIRNYFDRCSTKYTTPFCFYEALSVLKGKYRRGKLTRTEYLDAGLRLTTWFRVSSKDVRDLSFTDHATFERARSLVDRFPDTDLSDAFQILSVEHGYYSVLGGESRTVLVTVDGELAKAARSINLVVWDARKEEPPT